MPPQEGVPLGSLPEVLLQPELHLPLHSYEYEAIQLGIRDEEALSAAGRALARRLEPVEGPENLGSALGRFTAATGLRVRFFREAGGRDAGTGGLVVSSHPAVIFLNAASPARGANLLAHEWTHSLDKDPRGREALLRFARTLDPLLIQERLHGEIKRLRRHYAPEEIAPELLANIFGDALSPASQWGSDGLFHEWPAVRRAAVALWHAVNPLAPTGLQAADDAELARWAREAHPPESGEADPPPRA